MEINRSVVKQQAKALIKNNVFKLFIITVIIGIVTGGGMSFSGVGSGAGGVFDTNPFSQSDSRSDDDSDKESDKGSDYKNINPYEEFDRDYFNDFDGNGRVTLVKAEQEIPSGFKWVFLGIMGLFGVFASLAGLFLSPLQITLKGVFLQLIHGNNLSFGDGLSYVFKKTFDKNYWAKFVLNLIQGILLTILFVLFIIPGVIFTYKWRFTEYILADKPELSFSDAMRISGKMTAGHKWELFVLDLSFIPWYLLMIPTLGLINIYVVP
ncbi:MAG: DUF975 family protein [Ruminococcaceae bacterium]|nr:DUF975 family protein [Oscillospiraceae bacterium]